MPLYDYIYGTVDKSTDELQESALKRQEESPDVVHLTHLTTPDSVYHLRVGFAYLAAQPHTSKWYLKLMWPVTLWSMIFTWVYGRTFIVERNQFDKLKLQTWVLPKFTIQVSFQISILLCVNLCVCVYFSDQKKFVFLSLFLCAYCDDQF